MLGDVIMVLEFLYIFGEFFCIKQDFPEGITLGKYLSSSADAASELRMRVINIIFFYMILKIF